VLNLIITSSVLCIVINVRAYLMLKTFICSISILTMVNLNFLTMCFLCFAVSLRAENYVYVVLAMETRWVLDTCLKSDEYGYDRIFYLWVWNSIRDLCLHGWVFTLLELNLAHCHPY
jgi:hypothetical protein